MSSVFLPPNQTRGRILYDPQKSSTAKKLSGYSYSNCYGSGHCGYGVVYNDTITVGGISATLPFEVSTGNNGIGNSQGNGDSGDFGLAYSQNGMSTSPKAVPTWFQTIMNQLESKTFAIHHEQDQGQIQFGYVDSSYDIGYAPLNADYYWGVNFTGYLAAGNYIPRTWTVVVDTGTSRSSLPPDIARDYFKTVPGSTETGSGYIYPCDTALPDFVYGIGSFRGIIPGTFLQGNETSNGRCSSILGISDGSVIFGQNFIKAQYVVFDYGGRRVGFGNKVASQSSSTSPVTSAMTSEAASTNSTSPAASANPTIAPPVMSTAHSLRTNSKLGWNEVVSLVALWLFLKLIS